MPGRLTTHVLDTANGRPAAGIEIELFRVGSDGLPSEPLKTVRAGADGRTSEPLLAGEEFTGGVYEIVFGVGEYFADAGDGPPFLDRVPVRFGVADPSEHYHVPLIVSPWSYGTYRGS